MHYRTPATLRTHMSAPDCVAEFVLDQVLAVAATAVPRNGRKEPIVQVEGNGGGKRPGVAYRQTVKPVAILAHDVDIAKKLDDDRGPTLLRQPESDASSAPAALVVEAPLNLGSGTRWSSMDIVGDDTSHICLHSKYFKQA